MKTGFISSSNSLDHDTGEGHPENKFRIHSILDRLKKEILSNLIGANQVNLMKFI